MLFDSPFEMCNRCQVPHELLVNGGNEENTDNNFPPRIQSSRSTETHSKRATKPIHLSKNVSD